MLPGRGRSSTFGDLDNDGYLDLYVANGMIAEELFGHLPNGELVERNQAFRNGGNGYFTPAPQWHLNSTRSGRGMSMPDLDRDGDLDIVVNTLGSPAHLFENRLCGGRALEIDLFAPNTDNTRALGARLVLRTSAGTYYRSVHAVSGYLSGDSARVHFGFRSDTALHALEVRWPNGTTSHITEVAKNTLMRLTQMG